MSSGCVSCSAVLDSLRVGGLVPCLTLSKRGISSRGEPSVTVIFSGSFRGPMNRMRMRAGASIIVIRLGGLKLPLTGERRIIDRLGRHTQGLTGCCPSGVRHV